MLNFDKLTLFFLWFHQYPLVVVQEKIIRFICINAKLMCFLFVRKEVKEMDKKMFVTSLIFKITWDYKVCIKLKAATEQPVWFDLFVFLKKKNSSVNVFLRHDKKYITVRHFFFQSIKNHVFAERFYDYSSVYCYGVL